MPKKQKINKKSISGTVDDRVPVGEKTRLKKRQFPIVGIGASAGGLDALKALFSEVLDDTGMAYIIVVHMSPTQPSMMPDLLQRVTNVPVSTAQDGQKVEPDHIYVVPPDKEITLFKSRIQLLDKVRNVVTHPIDVLLKSLARDQGSCAVGIILSGTGTDGTLGIKEIKANDGLVVVQSEESSAYDGMPRSAISTGLVDMVVSPGEMPKILVQYFKHNIMIHDQASTANQSISQGWLAKVFAILNTHTGHDFSVYKPSTIRRRISRRMGINQIGSNEHYVRFLQENSGEVETLFRELLIGVTNFFRDTGSFDVLSTSILPDLLKEINDDETFRAWIPGCSTGEEVYSLAISLQECIKKIPKRINLQLFGTDIDKFAIDKAREGLYPASIAADVGAERLKRFFSKEGDSFRIRKEIRDCVVFSVQDVIKDPPFSRLNLLCCRNLLIYLDTEAQKKLLPVFHYTLRPGGILMLGSSESIGGFTTLFETLDKKWKLFRRLEVPQAKRQMVNFPSGPSTIQSTYAIKPIVPSTQINIAQLTQKMILDKFAPTAILIDKKGEILHIQGRTGNYLEIPSGAPTHNILDYARQGLCIELSSAIRAVLSSEQQVTRRKIEFKTNGDVQLINLHVCPLWSPKELSGCLLVVFEDIDVALTASGSDKLVPEGSEKEISRIAELEKELQINRENHQITIEELESSNEELKSTNEEMQSSNEELQSTNEELESSKEELQSLNEELQTVNAELQSKLEELSAIHDDMRNLLNSTEIATIFVDNDMRIRRFTQEATEIINLIETDIGRPLQHVVTNLSYDELIPDLSNVLEKLVPRVAEVSTTKGRWYNMRIAPYRTMDNRIDGAVLTFTSIDIQKKVQGDLQTAGSEKEKAWELLRVIFDMNLNPLTVLDNNARVLITNSALSTLLNIPPDEIQGIDILSCLPGTQEQSELQLKLKCSLEQDTNFTTEPFEMISSEGKQRVRIHGRTIKGSMDSPYRILLEFETDR